LSGVIAAHAKAVGLALNVIVRMMKNEHIRCFP
jgi:hypothetical protein